jgi:integrase
MIDAGIPLTSVSKFMGHSSIPITSDVYGHLIQGAEQRAAQTLDAYIDAESISNDELSDHESRN